MSDDDNYPAETVAGDVDLSDEVAVVERMLRHADLSTREVDAVRAVVVQATESTKWVDEGETRWDMAEALGFELVEDAPPWRDLRDAARLAVTCSTVPSVTSGGRQACGAELDADVCMRPIGHSGVHDPSGDQAPDFPGRCDSDHHGQEER